MATEEPEAPVRVSVCVGSSCHVRGSRDVLKRFARIIDTEDLAAEVSLMGAFCMERCGEGVNWKFNDEEITSHGVEEAEQTLRERLRAIKSL